MFNKWSNRIFGILFFIVLISLFYVSPAFGNTFINGDLDSENSISQDSFVVNLPVIFNHFISNGMVNISAGEFWMGCDLQFNGNLPCNSDGLPLHKVYVDSFFIDQTEVTNADYADCVNAGICEVPKNTSSYSRPAYFGNPEFSNFPVVYVSWDQANEYCSWMAKRLPTEAEWEKAARGENVRAFPWGNGLPDCSLVNSVNDVDNFSYCVGDTSFVGSYQIGASPYGAFDMAGNVYEWVSDWYSKTYYSSSAYLNPIGPESGINKVLRGGSFHVSWYYQRTADRHNALPTETDSRVGFRCAK